jgi:immune inhibitor A
MRRKVLTIAVALLLGATLMALVVAAPVWASPPYPEGGDEPIGKPELQARSPQPTRGKLIDQPNLKDYRRLQERMRLLEAGKMAEANALATTGEDRVLVILVEFAGTDMYTWTVPSNPMSPTIRTGSTWDPLGIADPGEDTGVVGDCSVIQEKIEATRGYSLTEGEVLTFTYQGPMHNRIPTPLSLDDRSGDSIFTTDFSDEWFEDFMFGNGVVISYTMQDGTPIYESFLGQSVSDYYLDMSSGAYTITGDVVGWLGLPHSTWYYNADECPGPRSGPGTVNRGVQEGVLDGTSKTLVRDALDAVNAISDTVPGFDWANYDLDGDGVIDRLWIVHAGYGTEDSPTLLNRMPLTGTSGTTDTTFYGEASVWSHSSQVTPPYSVTEDIAASPYIIMPENGGMAVFAHEYGHNLGADDLYAYYGGETSSGFWTLMNDSWTGYPIAFEPPAMDPWHLDRWGWLDPLVISDTTQTYEFTLGQASRFETTGAEYRGAKIELPDGVLDQPVPVWQGDYYWWGGKQNLANAMMTTKDPIAVTEGMTLSFDLAYDIEDGGWDFLWVMASPDGENWVPLTNENTQCATDPEWIGPLYGFPDDLCAAGLGGFYGRNPSWPAPDTQVFDLSAYAGMSGYLRFWYMTDWATTGFGPFVDNIEVGGFSDDAESGDVKWEYQAPWERSDGTQTFTHNFYLQWRNVDPTSDNYDSALGEERWRFGPANTGLLVWYNNNNYTDAEIFYYLEDDFSYGPKGRALVVDSHPEPDVNPYETPHGGLGAENANLTSRGLMRDAPFSLLDTVDYTYTFPYKDYVTPTLYTGRPAVPSFHDALGYYPGFNGPWAWGFYNTVDWDASAAVPAKASYSAKTPSGTDIPGFGATQYVDDVGWYYANVQPVEGGTGNPRDDNAQYGWHVEILDQTDMTATVQVWNSTVHKQVGPAPAEITDPGDHTLTYTVSLQNAGGMDPVDGAVTMTLPSALNIVDYTSGGAQTDNAVVWEPTLNQGEWMTFTTVATIEVEVGDPYTELVAALDVFDGSTTPPEHDEWVTPVSLFDVDAEVDGVSTKQGSPGSAVMYTVEITNTGDNDDTFDVTASSDPAWPTGLGEVSSQAASTEVELAPGEMADVGVFVMVPDSVTPGESAVTTVDVVSQGDPRRQATFEFTTTTLHKLYLPLIAKGF